MTAAAIRTRAASRRARPARACADDTGAGTIEAAILFPLVILMVMAALQVAFYFLGRAVAIEAAQSGVEAGRVYNAPANAAADKADSFLDTMGAWIDGPAVTVNGDANTVTVTVTGQAVAVFPGIEWTITQSAHGPRERVTTP